jgi:uncharacterized protein YbdZ (MbtH family)
MKSNTPPGPLTVTTLPVGETPEKMDRKRNAWLNIKEVWTDMRPLSLRKWMEESEKQTHA